MHLRIVTYNIHKGIGGRDRRYRLERIIETLHHAAADIVMLQEVDDGVPRSHFHRQSELLAEALDLPHFAYQRNVFLKSGCYGNALFSKFPLTDVHSVDLSIRFKKRRQALLARCKLTVDGHTRSLRLANVHLGLSGSERVFQLRKLLVQNELAHASQRTPIAVGGDFNDVWGSLNRRVMQPAGYEAAAKKIRTFPATLPLRPLDNVFVRGPVRVEQAFASRTLIARQASDHLPLVVDMVVET